jgi:hypothetical protein
VVPYLDFEECFLRLLNSLYFDSFQQPQQVIARP